jgi:hypothetical protein
MNKVSIRGSAGEVMWGYYIAASVGSWSISTEGSERVLTGTVTHADALGLSQPVLTFRVSRQNGTPWVWALTGLQIADGTLSAHVSQE